MEDVKELQELLHKLVNKTVSAQSILKILDRSELDKQQRELLKKTKEATEQSLQIIKQIREKLR